MTVPNTATEGAEQPAKKPGMMPIIAAALIGILVGAAAGSFVIGPKLAASMHIGTMTAADSAKLAEAEAPSGKEGKEGASNVHMIENLVLGLAGGAAGLLLASAALRGVRLLLPVDFPRAEMIQIDTRVMLVAAMLSCVAGLAIAFLPARLAAARCAMPCKMAAMRNRL